MWYVCAFTRIHMCTTVSSGGNKMWDEEDASSVQKFLPGDLDTSIPEK